jgi:dTDP-glucose 4,6-dehydratase
MRYFVTGGAGFIGSNYVEYLLENVIDCGAVTVYDKFTYASNPKNYERFRLDPRFSVIQGDICDFTSIQNAMSEHDYVIHFAAESHVDNSITDASRFVQTNVMGTFNVLESARINSIKTMIHISTDEVYGSLENGAADEDFILKPNSPYAASKASSDLLARSFFVTYGLDVRVTRCCNNYGKYQYPEKVIPVFISRLASGNKVPIYGDGKNIREWIHVSDHCSAIQTVLEQGQAGEIYNIGSGEHLDNNELASMIISTMGLPESSKDYVMDRLGHDFRYSVNSSKVKDIGFRSSTNIKEGIPATIEWFLDNQNWWE